MSVVDLLLKMIVVFATGITVSALTVLGYQMDQTTKITAVSVTMIQIMIILIWIVPVNVVEVIC